MNEKRLLKACLFLGIISFAEFNSSKVYAQDTAAIKNAQRQIFTISGTVTDGTSSPLSDVRILNRRTKKEYTTAADGKYFLEVRQGDSLTAYLTDYRDYSFIAGDQLVMNFQMDAKSGSEEDVVVVGFGTQKKISLTGAQSSVSAKELQHPVANLSTMLAGRVSGLVGVQRSGLPGSNSSDIWIRGLSTFGNNSNSPLVIVDGIQGRSLDNIDPENIASFTVLKDASATAVYGAQGANGVIIIETKKGSAGKVNLMVNYNEGFTQFTKLPKMADAKTYMQLRNEAMVASGQSPAYSQAYIDSTLSPTANHYVYPDVDWLGMLFNKTSNMRSLKFSATGGTDNTQFYTAVSYYDESSLLKTDGLQNYNAGTRFQRYNYVSNVNMKWTKTTNFYLGIMGYVSNFNEPGAGATSAFTDAMGASPVLYPAMYPNGLVAGIAQGSNPSPNPWADITQTGYSNTFTSSIQSTIRLSQDLRFVTKGLSVEGLYSFDNGNSNTQARTRSKSVYYLDQANPYNDDGSLNVQQVLQGTNLLSFSSGYSQSRQYTLQGQALYTRAFGDHNLYAMVVYNQKSIPNPGASSATDAIPERTQNWATRETYNYQNKYFFEFDGAFTGSQVFSPEHRYGFFPSFSAGWVLSNESWWRPLDNVFNFFKLRYSNGFSGAIGGTRFDYLTTIGTANGQTFGKPGASSSYDGLNVTHYGADVRWAKSHDQDLGWEFKTFNNKLSVIVDWFRKYRTGVFLTRANFPSFAGLQYNPDGNYGITLNKGFDATIVVSPFKIAKDLNLDLRGTVTYNKDRLIENGAAPYEEPWMDPRGQNINATQGYVADGLFQSEADILNHADQSGVGGTPRVGDIKYKDLNGDGIVNVYDQTTISHGDVPFWTFGLGVNLTYKQFYLSAFFQGTAGATRLMSDIARSPFYDGAYGNVLANATDRWTEENHATNPFYPRLGYGTSANANNSVNSTWWVKNMSFVRLKTLDFGYNLPKGSFHTIGMSNAQIFFAGVNMFYWSPFKLWDPEVNTGSGASYPNTRTMTLGIRANF